MSDLANIKFPIIKEIHKSKINAVQRIPKSESKDAVIESLEGNSAFGTDHNSDDESYKDVQIKDLKAQNQELKKYIESKLEMEKFAYIASHDLKAPLRTVSSFSQLMKKSHYSQLDPKGKKYIDIITKASEDMICLIDDLLRYSEITTSEINISEGNLDTVLHTLVMDNSQEIEELGAKVVVDKMPQSLHFDKQRIYQLFNHLLDNSLKFRNVDAPLKVRLTSEELNEHWLIKVIDNGIGMPPQFNEKAFELFKKHKTNDDRKGTGIGLTLSRAITRLHDGKIWVEGNLENGNTTCVMLSKQLGKS